MTDSAFLYTLNPDGSAMIGYEDYDVDIFDGDDYEVTYLLDATNFTNLLHHLNIPLNRDTKKLLKKEFGNHFDSTKFEEFCKKHGVTYERNVRLDN